MRNTLLKVVGIVAISATLFSSCISTNKGYQSSPVLARPVQLDPIKADIEVDQDNKLKGSSTSTYFLMFRVNGDKTFADGINYSTESSTNPFIQLLNAAKNRRLTKVRAAAAYKALEGGDYDFLVHPTYKVTVENYLIVKLYKVEVEGYGATYKNFRTEKQKIVILEDGKEIILQDRE